MFHLEREKSDLAAQLLELQHISRSEHEASVTREQELVEKVADMTSTVAELTSSNTGVCVCGGGGGVVSNLSSPPPSLSLSP